MRNIILAAMIALAGVSSTQIPAQAASGVLITKDGVEFRHGDRDRRHFRREVRREREFRRERREFRRDRREFRREMRRDDCRTRRVTHWRHNRMITEVIRVCN